MVGRIHTSIEILHAVAGLRRPAMRWPGAGVNVGGIMVVVAIVSITLAASNAESAPGAAIATVIACISYLGYKRYSAAVIRRQAHDLTIGPRQKAFLLLTSAIFSASVVGLSDIALLIGYFGSLKIADGLVVMSHWTPYGDPGFMAAGGGIGGVLALSVASSLRRTIDRANLSHSRRWLSLWPVGLVIFLGTVLGAAEMRERYSFCQMMAAYHAGPEARAEGPKTAKKHAWLKRWYERASIRPWLPIHRADSTSPRC